MAKPVDYLRLLRPRQRAAWSIGIYAGTGPFDLRPHPALGDGAVLTPRSLGAIKADGVADPFMLKHGSDWLMFFEIENRVSGRGEIGLATSLDALSWEFAGVVLKEPFHLSYPHVWEFEGAHFMVPESVACGAVRLYKADSFPLHWTLQCELVRGSLVDATPFRHDDRWWMIAMQGFRGEDAFVVHWADRLEGPWHAHPGNPISRGNPRSARPAGRVIRHREALIRFAQDGEQHYGRLVRAYEIAELTTERYVERPLGDAPVLAPSGQGWNATGMHHVDLHETGDGKWIACVDGRRTVTQWPVLERAAARLGRLGGAR